ncbi:MAG: homogentisate 1,2-dioxygenase [Bdellovibrionaceae bacterium]|nr:homogentisate 1,2-dioxygenase [Pseudobdellovibrionaceae bacterium]
MKKRQAHKNIPKGCFEEEQGQGGFYGAVSHLIKKKPSTRWSHIEGDLKPRMFNLAKLQKADRLKLLYNDFLNISYYKLEQTPDSAFRNANGDVLFFCHEGKGVILTEYGLLNYQAGQYILMPKCLTHFFKPEKASSFFVVESLKGHFREPDRGLLGRNALYGSSSLIRPDLEKLKTYIKDNSLEIKKITVYHQDKSTHFTYDESIFDVVEWQGDLFPFTLDMHDIMPVVSHRVHLPPSVHTTFLTDHFIVCSFLPRPLEEDEDALKVPFYHQNTDYDEVIFYHKGDFFSRDNLDKGMMSLHPAGFPHGPHPKAIEAVKGKTHTNEYAVMIDSHQALKRSSKISSLEVLDYWKSWKT